MNIFISSETEKLSDGQRSGTQRPNTRPIQNYFTSERIPASEPSCQSTTPLISAPTHFSTTPDFSELAAVAESSGMQCSSSMPNMQNFNSSGRIVHQVFNSHRGAHKPMPNLNAIRQRPTTQANMHRFYNFY